MKRLNRAESTLTMVAASLFVALSYELKKGGLSVFGMPTYLIALLAFFLGFGFAKYLSKLIFGRPEIRKLIMGSMWVEGYWIIFKASNKASTNDPFSYIGVLELEYRPGNEFLKAVVTRYDERGIKSIGSSEIAYLNDDVNRMKYLNYFSISFDEISDRKGLAVSHFNRTGGAKFPNTLDGKIGLEGEGMFHRQTGTKIRPEVVNKLIVQYGEDEWIAELLSKEDPVAYLGLIKNSLSEET